VLNELILDPADTISFRIWDEEHPHAHTLPLPASQQFLNNARDLLYTAACDVVAPQAHHPRLYRLQAETFIKHCRMGQTQPGSFVLPIICPINQDEDLGWWADDFEFIILDEFPRQVTQRLMDTLLLLSSGLEQKQTGHLAELKDDSTISANFVTTLSRLLHLSEKTHLHITPDWSRYASASFLNQEGVTFTHHHRDALEELIQLIHPTKPEILSEYIGKIESLKTAPEQRDRFAVEVIFYYENPDGRRLRAYFTAPADAYPELSRAHRDSIKISVKGQLSQEGLNTRVIYEATFEVLS